MRGYRHLKQYRLRRLRQTEEMPESSPQPVPTRGGRSWLPAGWLAALMVLAPGSAYVSLSEAANPLFAWPAEQARDAIDGSAPPPVILPDRVRTPEEPTTAAAPQTLRITLNNGDTLAQFLDFGHQVFRHVIKLIRTAQPFGIALLDQSNEIRGPAQHQPDILLGKVISAIDRVFVVGKLMAAT